MSGGNKNYEKQIKIQMKIKKKKLGKENDRGLLFYEGWLCDDTSLINESIVLLVMP